MFENIGHCNRFKACIGIWHFFQGANLKQNLGVKLSGPGNEIVIRVAAKYFSGFVQKRHGAAAKSATAVQNIGATVRKPIVSQFMSFPKFDRCGGTHIGQCFRLGSDFVESALLRLVILNIFFAPYRFASHFGALLIGEYVDCWATDLWKSLPTQLATVP